jgi:hypothetical protein
MRQMMRQLSGSGLFGGGGGLKGKMMRRVAGMAGVPNLSGLGGDSGGELPAGQLPAGPSRKKLKKKRKKKRR